MNYGKTFVATTILNGQELKKQKNGIDGVVDYLTKELEFGHKAFIEDLNDNASTKK